MAKKNIILCADDYGISNGVNNAIEKLVRDKRLSAVSCMVSSPHFPVQPKILQNHHNHIAIGLHITLTYIPSLTGVFQTGTEKDLLRGTWLRRINRTTLEQEIRAQFEKFIAAFGFAPDFIDGHQHIHTLPIIRDIILTLRAHYAPHAWLRNVSKPRFDMNKKRWIMTVLGWRFRRMLQQHGITHNKNIYGFYDYTTAQDFAALFRSWIDNVKNDALFYVHPGFPDTELAVFDTVLAPRQLEYDFFASDVFADILNTDINLVTEPVFS